MNAKIPIVNERDAIIDYKLRSELDYSKDIFRSASLWITDSKGRILLAQRREDKKVDPGKWAEAVGGTVEENDTYEATIYREAEEELGVTGEQFKRGPKQFVDTPSARYFVQWYHVTLDWPLDAFRPQESEVQKVGWWDPEHLVDIRSRVEEFSAAIIPMVELSLE